MQTFLRNTWYVAAWAKELQTGTLLRRQLLGEYYVLFRDGSGVAKALVDRCPHRFAPLSMGKIVDDGSTIQCPYHGLRFNSSGECVHNPHGDGRIPKGVCVQALPVQEKYSAIWAWMGDPQKADPDQIPNFDFLSPETHSVACDMINIEGHYELETDNILDLSHIEFLHPLLSSPGVARGQYECVREGDTVWSRRFIKADTLAPFLQKRFGIELPPGTKADRWLDARWDAPACMALWTGAIETGKPREGSRQICGAHIFTPETEGSAHYFYGCGYPKSMGAYAQELAEEIISAAAGPNGIFTQEDKPMIEAQAQNMMGRDFWSMKPVVLASDTAAVRARRILARKIQQEQEDAGRVSQAS